MITVETTRDIDLINKAVFDAELMPYIGYEGVVGKYTQLSEQDVFLMCYDNGELLGSIVLTPLSSCCHLMHFSILPKHWGIGKGQAMVNAIVDFLKPHIDERWKGLAMVPESSTHMRDFCFSIGCKLDGTLRKAVKKNDKYENVLIFSYDIIKE